MNWLGAPMLKEALNPVEVLLVVGGPLYVPQMFR
jgi:hypothetical protein